MIWECSWCSCIVLFIKISLTVVFFWGINTVLLNWIKWLFVWALKRAHSFTQRFKASKSMPFNLSPNWLLHGNKQLLDIKRRCYEERLKDVVERRLHTVSLWYCPSMWRMFDWNLRKCCTHTLTGKFKTGMETFIHVTRYENMNTVSQHFLMYSRKECEIFGGWNYSATPFLTTYVSLIWFTVRIQSVIMHASKIFFVF